MIDEDKYGTVSSSKVYSKVHFLLSFFSLLVKKLHELDKLSWNLIIEREIRKNWNKFEKFPFIFYILCFVP